VELYLYSPLCLLAVDRDISTIFFTCHPEEASSMLRFSGPISQNQKEDKKYFFFIFLVSVCWLPHRIPLLRFTSLRCFKYKYASSVYPRTPVFCVPSDWETKCNPYPTMFHWVYIAHVYSPFVLFDVLRFEHYHMNGSVCLWWQ